MDYTAWKDRAAAELAELHDVRASSVPEREWKRFYIGRSSRQTPLLEPIRSGSTLSLLGFAPEYAGRSAKNSTNEQPN